VKPDRAQQSPGEADCHEAALIEAAVNGERQVDCSEHQAEPGLPRTQQQPGHHDSNRHCPR
jgi:hypothetical protein